MIRLAKLTCKKAGHFWCIFFWFCETVQVSKLHQWPCTSDSRWRGQRPVESNLHVIRSFLETATCVGISAVSIGDKMFDWCLLLLVVVIFCNSHCLCKIVLPFFLNHSEMANTMRNMIPITDRQSRTIDIVTTVRQVATVGNKSIPYEISS